MEHVDRDRHVVTEALMVAEFAAVHWQRKSVSAQPVAATAVEKQARYRPTLGQLSRQCLGRGSVLNSLEDQRPTGRPRAMLQGGIAAEGSISLLQELWLDMAPSNVCIRGAAEMKRCATLRSR